MALAMGIFSVIAVAAVAFATLGCGIQDDNGRSTRPHAFSREVDALLSDIESIQGNIDQKRFLSFSTPRDRESITQLLSRIQIITLRLDSHPHDQLALRELFQTFKELERFQILKRDGAPIHNFIQRLGLLIEKYARHQNVTFDDLVWPLFKHHFSSTLAPFANFSSAGRGRWKLDWVLNEVSYVSVNGFQTHTWLLSPSFDLGGVRNPSFKIKHTIIINPNNSADIPFSRRRILDTAFKAKVSVDYSGGDPAGAHWKEVSLTPLPSSYEFHTIDSPQVDLGDFAGKANVTVALQFSMDAKTLGRHYVNWQVRTFELLGATEAETLSFAPREKKLFEHSFNSNDFTPFQTLSIGPRSARWEPFGFNGRIVYAKVSGRRNQKNDAWLFSPRFILRDTSPSSLSKFALAIKHTVRNPRWEGLQLKVSTDYEGGNPHDATWSLLPIAPSDPAAAVPPDSWVDLNPPPIDLSAFLNQNIVIAFHYQSSPFKDSGVWEIESVTILGHGDTLKTLDYSVEIEAETETEAEVP